MEEGRRGSLAVLQERAVLVACLLPGFEVNPHDPLDELRSLADTAGAIVTDELYQKRLKPDPATFIGKGKVEELGEMAKAQNAQVIIFDNDLTPAQIGNIEEIACVKVIDRSELILDIFAGRAHTNEARLQVELAQLQYTYPRLRAMWSHLERIVGGAPTGIGTRGPGEQQLEIDRRIVQRKITALRHEIAHLQARKSREVQARNKDFFTVGLVGYTNAGKSTLFNTLTDGQAYADDKLFATLSTRTRGWDLGQGDRAMLSDTVGFIRNLPHHLVASFKATLEEAIHSDLLLIVLDVAEVRCRQQLQTVLDVLGEIGADQQERILLLNKLDKLEHNAAVLELEQAYPGAMAISARSGRGLDRLVEEVRLRLRGRQQQAVVTLPLSAGKAIQVIESRTQVLERQYEIDQVIYRVRLGQRTADQLRAMGVSVVLA